MGLYKDRLLFDPADLSESDSVGAYVRAGSDGDLVSSTNVGGKEGLDINVINTDLTVVATDFDIRDLSASQDNVAVSDGSDTLAINGDGSINSVVTATDLDIRDLTHVSDSIKVGDGTDFLEVNADGSINVNATLIGTASDGIFAEDSAHTTGDNGQFMLAVRNDAGTSLVDADGDYAPLQVDADGKLLVAADISVVTGFEKAEDAAHVSGDIGGYVLAVQQGTLASSVSNDGDYASFKLNSRGGLWTVPVGTVADDAADTENPVKVGTRALSGALGAVSNSGDRADLISDLYRRAWVNTAPNIGMAQGNVTVGAAEVALPASALAGRRKIIVQNTSSNDIYVGPTGVLTTTGLRVAKGATLELEAGPDLAFYAIAGGAGNVVRVTELA